jgi:hypothetical protein
MSSRAQRCHWNGLPGGITAGGLIQQCWGRGLWYPEPPAGCLSCRVCLRTPSHRLALGRRQSCRRGYCQVHNTRVQTSTLCLMPTGRAGIHSLPVQLLSLHPGCCHLIHSHSNGLHLPSVSPGVGVQKLSCAAAQLLGRTEPSHP